LAPMQVPDDKDRGCGRDGAVKVRCGAAPQWTFAKKTFEKGHEGLCVGFLLR
jgi:hypothetical protein